MEGFLNLAWLLPVPPFLAFVAILLFLNRNKTVSALTAIGSVLGQFISLVNTKFQLVFHTAKFDHKSS